MARPTYDDKNKDKNKNIDKLNHMIRWYAWASTTWF